MPQRCFGLTEEGLDKLHALFLKVLDLLKDNMSNLSKRHREATAAGAAASGGGA